MEFKTSTAQHCLVYKMLEKGNESIDPKAFCNGRSCLLRLFIISTIRLLLVKPRLVPIYMSIYFFKLIAPSSLLYMLQFMLVAHQQGLTSALNYKNGLMYWIVLSVKPNLNKPPLIKKAFKFMHCIFILCSFAEVLFLFYTIYKGNQLQKRKAMPQHPHNFREIFVNRMLRAYFTACVNLNSHSNVPTSDSSCTSSNVHQSNSLTFQSRSSEADARQVFSGWFFDSHPHQYYEENILEYIAFASYGKELVDLSPQEYSEVKLLWQSLSTEFRRRWQHLHKHNSSHFRSNDANSYNLFNHSFGSANCATRIPADKSQSLDEHTEVKIPKGYNNAVKCMRQLIDPIKYVHHPLMYYAAVMGIDYFARLFLYLNGYTRYSIGNSDPHYPNFYYYFKPGSLLPTCSYDGPSTDHANQSSPVIFLHGIGCGLAPYAAFIKQLHLTDRNELKENWKCRCHRPVYLFEIPYISMKIQSHVPTAEHTVAAISSMVDRHTSKRQVHLIGHSYGTILVSWIIKKRPQLVLSSILLDPVCFMLFESSLCYNFLYRPPTTPLTWLAHHYCARELHIAHTLTRNFWWWDNILWLEDVKLVKDQMSNNNMNNDIAESSCVEDVRNLGRSPYAAFRVTDSIAGVKKITNINSLLNTNQAVLHVFLSEFDDITNTTIIANYLQHNEYSYLVKIYWFPNFNHGQFITSKQAQEQILAVLNQ